MSVLDDLKVKDLSNYIKKEHSGSMMWSTITGDLRLMCYQDSLVIFNPNSDVIHRIPNDRYLDTVINKLNDDPCDGDNSHRNAIKRSLIISCLTAKHLIDALLKSGKEIEILYGQGVVVTFSICAVYDLERLSVTFRRVEASQIEVRRIYVQSTQFIDITGDIFSYTSDRLPQRPFQYAEIIDAVLLNL